MRNMPLHLVAQQAIRANVCTQCFQRPPGSEALGNNVARSCQPQCAIFDHLKLLLQIAASTDQPTLTPYERAIQDAICQRCTLSPSAGDYCGERSTQHCPLSRQMGAVVETLQNVVAASRKAKTHQHRKNQGAAELA